jgi:predicted hotdog family 3-hydroxylacyl-ACP dehydratase
LALSERMIRDALSRIDEITNPTLWAGAQNNLAIALQDQGIRQAGAAGVELLAQSVDAYRAALRVRTEADHPVD